MYWKRYIIAFYKMSLQNENYGIDSIISKKIWCFYGKNGVLIRSQKAVSIKQCDDYMDYGEIAL